MALVVVPPVVPYVNILVTVIALLKPPVPVHVKLVTFAIDNTTCATDACVSTIEPTPNCILRVLAPVELNIPVDKSNPFKFNVPVVSVVVEDAAIVRADPNVVVIPLALMVKAPNVVLPLL